MLFKNSLVWVIFSSLLYTAVICELDGRGRIERAFNNCSPYPCVNGGTCQEGINSYTCQCLDGFTGTNCSTDVDECSSTPCENGATCHDCVNDYTCLCSPGYTGTNCETDVNECATVELSMCDDRAYCTNMEGSYTCHCFSGYTGDGFNCSDIDECLSNPCENGGTCLDCVNWYTCQCVPGYTGTNCSADVDECTTAELNLCDSHANCTNTMGSYTCQCHDGYTGDGFNCSECRPWSTWHDCSVTCGNGTQRRSKILNPDCDPDNTTDNTTEISETRPCQEAPCECQDPDEGWYENCENCSCWNGQAVCTPIPCEEVNETNCSNRTHLIVTDPAEPCCKLCVAQACGKVLAETLPLTFSDSYWGECHSTSDVELHRCEGSCPGIQKPIYSFNGTTTPNDDLYFPLNLTSGNCSCCQPEVRAERVHEFFCSFNLSLLVVGVDHVARCRCKECRTDWP